MKTRVEDIIAQIIAGALTLAVVAFALCILAAWLRPTPVYYYGTPSAEGAYQQRAQHAEAMEEQSNRYGR